jgi:hypothetical protein
MGFAFEVSTWEREANHAEFIWIIKWDGEDFLEALHHMREWKLRGYVVRLVWRGDYDLIN